MNIIVMPLYGIGDALMSTPALRNIKERTGANITYLHMFKTTYDALEHSPYIDNNIYFPFFKEGFLKSLKFFIEHRGKYDVSINFYPTNRKAYNVGAFIVNSPKRIGHRYVKMDIKELNFLKNRTLMEDDSLHNVEENLRLLSYLDINNPEHYPLSINLAQADRDFARKWYGDNQAFGEPVIGFHAGSSVFKEHMMKRWPKEKFAELIRHTGSVYKDALFLLFGGPEEEPYNEELRELAGPGQKVFRVKAGAIRETAAVMEKCDVMASNDSGLMHLGASLQVPTVALFGPTNPVALAPWKVPHFALTCPVDCHPCFRYSPKGMRCDTDPYGNCIRGIETMDVFDAMHTLLG